MVGLTVRRAKALDFGEWNSRPGTGSLHPSIMQRLGLNEFSAFSESFEMHVHAFCADYPEGF